MGERYTVIYEGSPAGVRILNGEPAVGRAVGVMAGDLAAQYAREDRRVAAEIARLQSDLTAAREAEQQAWQDKEAAIVAVSKRCLAAEDNLIALAKMYGEACGELQMLRHLMRDVADEADDSDGEALSDEIELHCEAEARARAAEAEAVTLRAQLKDSAMQHMARDLQDEQVWSEVVALRERAGELERAIRPFAALATSPNVWTNYGTLIQDTPTGLWTACGLNILIEDIRTAAAVLSPLQTEKQDG